MGSRIAQTAQLKWIKTSDNFTAARISFLLTFFSKKSHNCLVDYLDKARKPRNMTELELAARLKLIGTHAELLPPTADPQKVLTDLHLKSIYFHMQPSAVQTQHVISGEKHEKNRTTLRKMAEFFSELESTPQFNPSHSSNRNSDSDRNY